MFKLLKSHCRVQLEAMRSPNCASSRCLGNCPPDSPIRSGDESCGRYPYWTPDVCLSASLLYETQGDASLRLENQQGQ